MCGDWRRITIHCKSILQLSLLFALLAVSVSCSFTSDNRTRESLVTLKGETFSVSMSGGGALLIETNNDCYTIESFFSHPGEEIGFNKFVRNGRQGGGAPIVNIRRISDMEGRMEATFADYSIARTVQIKGHRIEVSETIHNKKSSPVAVIINHTLIGASFFDTIVLGGYYRSGIYNFIKQIVGRTKEVSQTAENPTVYVGRSSSSLGIVVRDSLFRLQLHMNSAVCTNNVTFGLRHFSLDEKKSHAFQWDIYPMEKSSDYFTLINQIRTDWNTNYTIRGPFDFFDVVLNREIIKDSVRLKAYFQRKKAGILALTPWLDYTNYNFASGTFMTREAYKALMQHAFSAIKWADPSIKVIGCIENNLVSLPPTVEKLLPNIVSGKEEKQGIFKSSETETTLIREAELKNKDSLIVTEDGRYVLEFYGQMRDELKGEMGDSPFKRAIAVYSAIGNAHFENQMDQARFITDDVGLDGIYVDQFNMAFDGMQRYSYEKPDGYTADIDKKTGKIVRRYTDGSFVGIEAREKLIDAVLSQGKIVVANTHAAAKEIQSKPIYRFLEGGRIYNPLSLKIGREPTYNAHLTKGLLGSPIALGERHWYWGSKTRDDYARYIMKTIVVFLRHGLLYYYFNTEIPNNGAGKGEYGPINHMFPITPVSLGKGFIEGKERIITSVSGQFSWPQERKPAVLFFDMKGILKDGVHDMNKTPSGWKVNVKLNDWEEIAIVE